MSVLKVKNPETKRWEPIETIQGAKGEKGDTGDVDVTKLGFVVNPSDNSLYHYYKGNMVGTGIPWPSEYIEPEGMEISESSISFTKLGGKHRLTASILPPEATNKFVLWESLDDTVATVSEDGVVTSVGEGNTTIFARNVENNYSVSANVSVVNKGDVEEVYSIKNYAGGGGKTDRPTGFKPLENGEPFSIEFAWSTSFGGAVNGGPFHLYSANESIQTPIFLARKFVTPVGYLNNNYTYVQVGDDAYLAFGAAGNGATMKGVLVWDGEKITLRASMENKGYAPQNSGTNGDITRSVVITPSFDMVGDWELLIGINLGSGAFGTLESLVAYRGILEDDYITNYIDLGYDPTKDEIVSIIGQISSSGTVPPYTDVAYFPSVIPSVRNAATTKTVTSSDPTVVEVPT